MKIRKIRRAVPSDIVGMALLCVKYREESKAFSKYPLTFDILFKNLVQGLEDDNDILLVHGDLHHINGILWASKVPLLWADKSMYIDNVLYVDSSNRGADIATNLIKEYERIAISKDVDYIKLSSISGIANEKVSELYSKLGFEQKGIIHLKEYNG